MAAAAYVNRRLVSDSNVAVTVKYCTEGPTPHERRCLLCIEKQILLGPIDSEA